MSGPLTAVARLGDKFSHSVDFDDADGATLLGAVMGQLVDRAGGRGALGATVGQGIMGDRGGAANVVIRCVTANSSSGKVEYASENTFMGKDRLGAALVNHEDESCSKHSDKPLASGAPAVFVNRKRLARAGDETGCGALIFGGEPTILVGGPPSKEDPPPARMQTQDVLGDVSLDEGAVSGSLLGRMIALGNVQVIPPEWAGPVDGGRERSSRGSRERPGRGGPPSRSGSGRERPSRERPSRERPSRERPSREGRDGASKGATLGELLLTAAAMGAAVWLADKL